MDRNYIYQVLKTAYKAGKQNTLIAW